MQQCDRYSDVHYSNMSFSSVLINLIVKVMTTLIKIDIPSTSHHGWCSRTNMALGLVEEPNMAPGVVGWEWEDLGCTSSRQTSLTRASLFTPIWSVGFIFLCLLCLEFVCSLISVLVHCSAEHACRLITSLRECQ